MLGQLTKITDPNVLVGAANADDAGVYKINDDVAVVLTVDYFTPIVDDPYMFGAIAAANSLSDVWAMGGRPVAALNISNFPSEEKFLPILREVMRGGNEKMAEAGVSVVGGHTVKDKEPKYGFSVLGLVHPERIYDNTKARPGDAMVLTKKIGTGIISTGIRSDMCGEDAAKEIIASMAALNRRAAELSIEAGVSTITDITGFGLIGHMYEVMSASGRVARLYTSRVPFFDEAVRLAREDIIPAGTVTNLKTYSRHIKWSDEVTEDEKILLNDAQTSGGLLVFVPAERKDALVAALREEDIPAAHIGDVLEGREGDKEIHVEK